MLRFLRSKMRLKACDKEKGQVAFVLILITAAALIFYAVTLNLSKVSTTKTLTTVAANTGASILASQMASYAQSLVMEYLRGTLKYCKSTSLIGAIITLVIAIVVAIYTYGTGGVAIITAMAIISVAIAAVSVAMNALVVQPGITQMWNEMSSKSMSQEDQFLENGLRTALQTAVGDHEMVPDLYDYDLDRVWGWGLDDRPRDRINRYAYYYTQRLKDVELPDLSPVNDFLDELKEFVFNGSDGWALFDPLDTVANPAHPCSVSPPLSECNPCCVPSTEQPECCSAGTCGDPNSCDDALLSPYLNANANESYEYKYIYNPIVENDINAFQSFLEGLGKDDGNIRYYKNIPTDIQQVYAPDVPAPLEFEAEDTSGLVHPPLHKWKFWGTDLSTVDTTDPMSPDEHDYWTENGCMNLAMPTELQAPCLSYQYPWGAGPIDAQSSATIETNDFVENTSHNTPNQPPLASDVVLIDAGDFIFADDAACASDALPPNWNFYDATFSDAAYMTGLGAGFWKEGADLYCNTGDLAGTPWPYSESCPREGGTVCTETTESWYDDLGNLLGAPQIITYEVTCPCGSAGTSPSDWHDDVTDEWRYGVSEFLGWALDLIRQYEENPTTMVNSYASWYGDAAQWIEPRVEQYDVTSAGVVGVANDVWDYYSENYDECWATNPATGIYIPSPSGPCCYVCGEFTYDAGNVRHLGANAPYHGAMQNWIEELSYVRRQLESFQEKSFAGTECYQQQAALPQSEVWCVPPTEVAGVTCPVKNADEATTFDSNGNGIVGDMEDVIACLDWNANDTTGLGAVPALFSSDPTVFKGNWAKFYECRYDCNDANCQAMPRSLVPGFDDETYFPNDPAGTALLQACQSSVDVIQCSERCSTPTPLTPAIYTTYSLPAWDAPVFNLNSASSLSAFYTGLMTRINDVVFRSIYPATVPVLQTCVDSIDAGVLSTIITNCASIAWPADYTWSNVCRTTSALYTQVTNRIASPLLDLVERTPLLECQGAINAIGVGPGTVAQINNCQTQCTPDTAAGIRVAGPPLANPEWINVPGLLTLPWPGGAVAVPWVAPTVADSNSCGWLDGGDMTFKNALDAAAITAGGSCADLVFLNGVEQSMYEAMVQGRKFEQRRLFLQNRRQELVDMTNFLTEAETKFTEFYTGPVDDFIKFIMTQDSENEGLQGEAIYGWRNTPDSPTEVGSWHIVRVDARSPGRCWGCDPSQTRPQPYPSVKTETSRWGTKRCYFLVNYVGTVKVRVTRYDEDKSAVGHLLFPNGVPIWDFRFVHTDRGETNTVGLTEVCLNVTSLNPVGAYSPPAAYLATLHPQLKDMSGTERIYGGAFIMNKYIPIVDPDTGLPNSNENDGCWKRATQLLGYGITTETCAQYYWGGAGRMQVKFVPCKTW